MKTVKELINELLEFDMDAQVNLTIMYADVDDVVDKFTIEETKTHLGSKKVHIIVDFEEFNYHDRMVFEEQ